MCWPIRKTGFIPDSKFETRNSKLEIRNSKFETRNSKFETRNSKLEIRNSKFKTQLTNQIASRASMKKMAAGDEKITVQQGKRKFSFVFDETSGFKLSELGKIITRPSMRTVLAETHGNIVCKPGLCYLVFMHCTMLYVTAICCM